MSAPIRLLHGIRWRAICPSHYELEVCPVVSITYLGTGAPGESNQWFLHVPDRNGEPRLEPYESLAAAALPVAQALR